MGAVVDDDFEGRSTGAFHVFRPHLVEVVVIAAVSTMKFASIQILLIARVLLGEVAPVFGPFSCKGRVREVKLRHC